MQNKYTSIPDRWEDYSKISDELVLDKIFSFKTLTSEFDVNDLESLTYNKFSRNIGIVIDLTNTDKYYNYNSILDRNIKYIKIQCKGYKSFPTKETVDEFNLIVDAFMKKPNRHLIGVHCTHGFNRTGFMICSYLHLMLGYDIKLAIEMFNKIRAPGIYKEDYIAELISRYS